MTKTKQKQRQKDKTHKKLTEDMMKRRKDIRQNDGKTERRKDRKMEKLIDGKTKI